MLIIQVFKSVAEKLLRNHRISKKYGVSLFRWNANFLNQSNSTQSTMRYLCNTDLKSFTIEKAFLYLESTSHRWAHFHHNTHALYCAYVLIIYRTLHQSVAYRSPHHQGLDGT